MNISINLARGSRVDPQRAVELLQQALNGEGISLPADPGEGQAVISLPLEGDLYMRIFSQFGQVEALSFIRRVIAATLVRSSQETQPTSSASRFQLSESAKENLGLILALVIPIVIMGLLIWVLGRGAKAGGGFAEWAGGGTAT
jgi:hypothetical protein